MQDTFSPGVFEHPETSVPAGEKKCSSPCEIHSKECKRVGKGGSVFHAFACRGKLDFNNLLLQKGFICPEERICCVCWGLCC